MSYNLHLVLVLLPPHPTLPYYHRIHLRTGSLDKDRLSPLALASLHPPLHLTVQYLQFEIDKLQSSLQSDPKLSPTINTDPDGMTCVVCWTVTSLSSDCNVVLI